LSNLQPTATPWWEEILGTRIVEKSVKKLKAPQHGSRIEWDSEIPGFGVRITSGGVISFVLDYRISGRQKRYTIGRYTDLTVAAARVEAVELRAGIREGHDPMEERKQSRLEPTLGDLATEYLDRHAVPNKRASSLRMDRQMIEKIIRPKIGHTRLRAVTRRDIETLHLSLKAKLYTANRVLSLLSKMFNLGIQWKWITENPVKGVPRFQEAKRERWLTAEEIQQFRKALDAYKYQSAANALKLLLLTGSRESEVLKAEWDQFDFERKRWTKPSHNTKQKRTEHIPLSQQALDLLLAMLPKEATGPLFPGKKRGARVSLRRPWIQACKAAGLVSTEQVRGKRKMLTKYRPTVRIHDLRHSYASHLVSSGVSLQTVGKLLGHTQSATTMRYAHLQDAILRDATNRFGDIYTETKNAGSEG
jgi:integrase